MGEIDAASRVDQVLEPVPRPREKTPPGRPVRDHCAWTPEEDGYLRMTFRKVSTREIAARLCRTRAAVYQRALKVLLLPKTREHPAGMKWELAGDTFLRENYGRIPTKQVASALGRTVRSIHSRARTLHLTRITVRGPNRPWTEDDERYLLANCGSMAVKEIASRLNRTSAAVHQRASFPRWGAKAATRPRRNWLDTEDEVLRAGYRRVPTRSIAQALNRTVSSVNVRACVLGLTRHFARSPPRAWTRDEDEFLRASYGRVRPAEMAKKLGRTRASVYHRAALLELTSIAGSPEFLRRQSLPRTAQPFAGLANPVDLGYVAGILDGEGSIVGPPRITLQVSMTTKEVIERLHSLCGGSITGPYENRSGRSEVCQPQYHWTVSSAESAYRILNVLLPHLIVKREKAEMAIQFLKRKWFP
jgi:hypothetical protein